MARATSASQAIAYNDIINVLSKDLGNFAKSFDIYKDFLPNMTVNPKEVINEKYTFVSPPPPSSPKVCNYTGKYQIVANGRMSCAKKKGKIFDQTRCYI